MSKLNKIFYGPAGTGKTREAIREAVKLVGMNGNQENYDEILKIFQDKSKLPDLEIKNNSELMQKIQDPTQDVDKIIQHQGYKGYLEHLEKPKDKILEYRAYPFIETVTFHPSIPPQK